MKKNRKTGQMIRRALTLITAVAMVIAYSVPAMAAETAGASSAEKKVQLKYIDPSGFEVSDSARIFVGEGSSHTGEGVETVTVNTFDAPEGDTLPKGPEVEGWKFEGWYTQPVMYAFWGDTPDTEYTDTEEIPENFKVDCDGNPQEYRFSEDLSSKDEENIAPTLDTYWIWLSTFDGEAKGIKYKASDKVPEDGGTLYALYSPKSYVISLDYSGWNGRTGSLESYRQSNTPFGKYELKNWNGFEFEGWFKEGTKEQMSFYDVPKDSGNSHSPTKYVAHWHKTKDPGINQDTYAEKGYEPVTRISVSRAENENYSLSKIETSACQSGQTVKVKARTNRPEVTKPKLEWTSSDNEIAEVKPDAGNPLRAEITIGEKAGTATITVKVSGSDNVEKKFTVKNKAHISGESTVVKRGCKGPVKISHTCAYCREVWIENLPENKHNFGAYKDGVRYCKVCGEPEYRRVVETPAAPAEAEKAREEAKQQPAATPEVSAPQAAEKQTSASKPAPQASKPAPQKQTSASKPAPQTSKPAPQKQTSASKPAPQASKPAPQKQISASKPAAQASKPAALKANSITASNFTKTTSAKAQSFNIRARTKGGARLTYVSNNKSVAVNGSGRVTAKAKFVGKATITIKSAGTGKYKPASKKITVTVNPPKVKLSSAKNLPGRKVQVKWKKNSLAGGYQVRYSTNKSFKSGVKTITASKNSKTSAKISRLKKGKTYYVQVRTYKKVSGKNYCSAWSPVKSVRIK